MKSETPRALISWVVLLVLVVIIGAIAALVYLYRESIIKVIPKPAGSADLVVARVA